VLPKYLSTHQRQDEPHLVLYDAQTRKKRGIGLLSQIACLLLELDSVVSVNPLKHARVNAPI
jgi:hypothetical protein